MLWYFPLSKLIPGNRLKLSESRSFLCSVHFQRISKRQNLKKKNFIQTLGQKVMFLILIICIYKFVIFFCFPLSLNISLHWTFARTHLSSAVKSLITCNHFICEFTTCYESQNHVIYDQTNVCCDGKKTIVLVTRFLMLICDIKQICLLPDVFYQKHILERSEQCIGIQSTTIYSRPPKKKF